MLPSRYCAYSTQGLNQDFVPNGSSKGIGPIGISWKQAFELLENLPPHKTDLVGQPPRLVFYLEDESYLAFERDSLAKNPSQTRPYHLDLDTGKFRAETHAKTLREAKETLARFLRQELQTQVALANFFDQVEEW